MLGYISLAISAVLAIVIVNFAYNLFASIIGGAFFYSVKTKLIAYFFVFMFIWTALLGIFGGV